MVTLYKNDNPIINIKIKLLMSNKNRDGEIKGQAWKTAEFAAIDGRRFSRTHS
jgi:hypothetical protein